MSGGEGGAGVRRARLVARGSLGMGGVEVEESARARVEPVGTGCEGCNSTRESELFSRPLKVSLLF